jgi:hypothetical protein
MVRYLRLIPEFRYAKTVDGVQIAHQPLADLRRFARGARGP